ncbi:LysR family transcriptional regulator [Pusillimonas sp. TS35]|uniref:LysR substrate-binding domain-containing protein n=1 Tax=Paracandidimonas lactea TaxID=2895524 RepID=UPI001369EB71|nr:LysR substrate-binding domain-containing protein [Paracandidimonas lactea]MYN11865.1 LysR family transcriptional regulator [Pusillimonas sp. TS35]
MDTIRFLRTFLAVARSNTFAEAADVVALTQSAVSFQMRALEQQLNRRLFERQGRLSVLTAEGRAMLPEAQALLDQFERLRGPQPGQEDDMAGAVTFGAIVSCMGPLSKGVSRLKARYPNLEVRLTTGRSGALAAQVESDMLDAAIIVAPPRKRSTLNWLPLREEPLVVVAPAHAAVKSARDAVERYPFLRFDRREFTGRLVDRALKRMHCRVNEFLELNSMDTLVALVRQDVGVTVLPMPVAVDWASDASLQVLPLGGKAGEAVRHIGALSKAGHPHPRLIDAFCAVCKEMF